MNNTEIVDWMEAHDPIEYENGKLSFFAPVRDSYILDKYGPCYAFQKVFGASLRECVIKAMGEEYARDQIEDAKPGPGKESLGGVE